MQSCSLSSDRIVMRQKNIENDSLRYVPDVPDHCIPWIHLVKRYNDISTRDHRMPEVARHLAAVIGAHSSARTVFVDIHGLLEMS